MAGLDAGRSVAVGLWLRAALRLPMLMLVAFYAAHGVRIDQRSAGFPDEAAVMWLSYLVSEVDNLVTVPATHVAEAAVGADHLAVWAGAYLAGTVAYLAAGRLMWRGGRPRRTAYRAAVAYLALSAGVHLVTLIGVAPSAVRGALTPEGSYPAVAFVHAYEWLLLPWALALPAVTVAVAVLLRRAARAAPVR